MDLSEFDFELPEHLIALRPVEPQDIARLLVVHGDGRLEDRQVLDLPELLAPKDVLVFNDTRVLPAALKGVRRARDVDGRDVDVDLNLVEDLGGSRWAALARPARRLRPSDTIEIAAGLSAKVTSKQDDGPIEIVFNLKGHRLTAALDSVGAMPLPPYIARRRPADEKDRQTYQTRFAEGDAKSVAAPTAGLHFTDRLFDRIDMRGLGRETVRLHVGMGTFAPLDQTQLTSGTLHEEWRSLSTEAAERLNSARREGRRCVPVGTTSMRTLESCVDESGLLHPATGPTDIFIRPGDPVRATDGLMTNFHLPRSSLFMLVCALMGTEVMQAAYAHAIRQEYRFYSYGDACLLLPPR